MRHCSDILSLLLYVSTLHAFNSTSIALSSLNMDIMLSYTAYGIHKRGSSIYLRHSITYKTSIPRLSDSMSTNSLPMLDSLIVFYI